MPLALVGLELTCLDKGFIWIKKEGGQINLTELFPRKSNKISLHLLMFTFFRQKTERNIQKY